jgi:hypothetical protein
MSAPKTGEPRRLHAAAATGFQSASVGTGGGGGGGGGGGSDVCCGGGGGGGIWAWTTGSDVLAASETDSSRESTGFTK